MGDVSEKFLTPMLVFFSLPNSAHADREAFLSGYVDELSEYTSHELEHAAKLLRTTRTTRTLPTIADCLEACKQARDTLQAPAKRRHGSDQVKWPEWAPERQRLADDLIRSEIGRKAADEGWLIGLWDFCRKEKRQPNRFEAERIAQESRKTWQIVDEVIQAMIENGQDASGVIGYKRSGQKRFQDLKDKVYADKEMV